MAEKAKGTKRIGIVVDAYKMRKFKRALARSGYAYGEAQLPNGLKLIYCDRPEHLFDRDMREIGKICKKLEIDFKQSN